MEQERVRAERGSTARQDVKGSKKNEQRLPESDQQLKGLQRCRDVTQIDIKMDQGFVSLRAAAARAHSWE